ncbi:MAG: hypothetical protein ACLTS6_18185 [Anaerobutyricum sp.]
MYVNKYYDDDKILNGKQVEKCRWIKSGGRFIIFGNGVANTDSGHCSI